MRGVKYLLLFFCLVSTNLRAQSGWVCKYPYPTSNILYSSSFVSGTTGWIAGEYGTLYKTSDGGITWLRENAGTDEHLFSIFFTDELNGWACGSYGTIIHTTNGGTEWRKQEAGTSSNLNSIAFINGSTGLIAGSNGTILRTSNGGDRKSVV